MSGRQFHVLYQNMTVFGGGSVARNRAFTSGFSQIALGSAANRVLVAGFTEIGNAGPAVSALTALAANIDDTLQGSYTIAVGLSATGLTEYAYLATYAEDAANTFHVDGYGKVIGAQDETQWTCYPAATLASASLPVGLTPGSRGLAYVTGTIVSGADPSWQGKQLAVLFTHGMYGTGDVYGGMQRLPGAVVAVYAAHKLPATVGYVLAGDFNASPGRSRPAGRPWPRCSPPTPPESRSAPPRTTPTTSSSPARPCRPRPRPPGRKPAQARPSPSMPPYPSSYPRNPNLTRTAAPRRSRGDAKAQLHGPPALGRRRRRRWPRCRLGSAGDGRSRCGSQLGRSRRDFLQGRCQLPRADDVLRSVSDYPLWCSCWPAPFSGSSTPVGITVPASPASSSCGI